MAQNCIDDLHGIIAPYSFTIDLEKLREELVELLCSLRGVKRITESHGEKVGMRAMKDIAVITEMADVRIMIRKLEQRCGLERLITDEMEFKIARQMARVEMGE